jgi:phage replication O-like protein O
MRVFQSKEQPVGANPQIEDGHIDIANEIAEALARVQLSGYEWRILWVIFRKTYGWHKKMDQISITQFEKATGLKRWHVHRTLSILTEKNIVTKIGNSRIITYRFQKDYTKWKDITKKGNNVGNSRLSGQGKKETITKIGNRSLPKLVNTKENNKRKYYVEGSDEFRLASFLLEEIKQNKPTFKQPDLQTWAREIDLMIRRDGRTPDRIQQVIEWSQNDNFWWKNILSASKLRKQFDRLEAEMETGKNKTQNPRVSRIEYQDLTIEERA